MHDNPSDQSSLALAAAMAVGDALTPELLTRNMADVLSMFSADSRDKKFVQITSGLVKGMIPFSALLRDIRKGELPFPGVVEDRFQRDVKPDPNGNFKMLEEMLNRIKKDLPGVSSSLPPLRTVFGEPITYPEGWGPDMASPIAFTRKVDSPIIDEVIRLGITGPLLNPTPPQGESHLVLRMPDRVVTKSLGAGARVAVKLDPKQYDKLVQLSAGIGLGKGIPKLEERLNETLKSDSYKKSSDEKRRLIILNIVSGYRQAAKAKLAEQDSTIPEQLRQLGIEKKEAIESPRPSQIPSL